MNKSLFILFLIVILLIPVAYAKVSVTSEYYNSENHVYEKTVTKNANYKEKTLVVPYMGFKNAKYSILSVGEGESTDNLFEVYYSLAMNNENMGFNIKSDSGNLKWERGLASSFGNVVKTFGAEFSSDGYLQTTLINNDVEINEKIRNGNTLYTGKASMSNDKIIAFGNLSSQDQGKNRSFSVSTHVKTGKKETFMNAALSEEQYSQHLSFECKNKVSMTKENGSIDKLVKIDTVDGFGIVTNNLGSIEAYMNFGAYEDGKPIIPPQSVPPNGKLKILVVPLGGYVNVEEEVLLRMSADIWK